jgi:LacI family transcriptional regulator
MAIELDQPSPHHLGCYAGILRYAAAKDNWQTVVDPYVVGVTANRGAREYDGIVGRIHQRAAEEAAAARIPVVNHWVNSPAKGFPSVLPDIREGSRIAAEHLLSRGFRRFAYIGSKGDRTRYLHLAGFEPPIKKQGGILVKFDTPKSYEQSTERFTKFSQSLITWLDKLTKPVAILSSQEVTGLYVVQACRQLGIRVPQEVGIVVCRENLTIALQTSPTLSGVEDNNDLIGYRSAELLDRLMQKKVKKPKEPILIPPKALRVRGSSDAIVSDDLLVSQAMRYMTENASRFITVADIAEAIDTSPRTLQLRFNQHVGHSVSSEINRLRIEMVKRILMDTDARLESVARECGYTDTSHLVKSFRKTTGITPGEFRKQHRTP